MYPDKIFGLFTLYGLMIAVGILACFGVLFHYGKKRKVNESFIDFVFYNGIASIIVGFGSAALFQATYNYIDDPDAGFKFGGITFIGGLIGGIACFLIVYFSLRKKLKGRVVDIVSVAPCCILIAHAFGRVGCFFAGCCYGKETNNWLGVQFPDLPHKVYPAQLYEAIFLFALFAVCYILLWKWKFKYNLSLYLVAYGIFRFLIEFLRDDARGQFIVKWLSPSQFWSVLMVVGGVAVYFLLKRAFALREQELAKERETDGETEAKE